MQIVQNLISSIHLQLMRLRGKDVTHKGTWFAISESDPRWNGQASQLGDMIDTQPQKREYRAQKIALYGNPPEDLLWAWRREK